jgi:hypothetical protein
MLPTSHNLGVVHKPRYRGGDVRFDKTPPPRPLVASLGPQPHPLVEQWPFCRAAAPSCKLLARPYPPPAKSGQSSEKTTHPSRKVASRPPPVPWLVDHPLLPACFNPHGPYILPSLHKLPHTTYHSCHVHTSTTASSE